MLCVYLVAVENAGVNSCGQIELHKNLLGARITCAVLSLSCEYVALLTQHAIYLKPMKLVMVSLRSATL